ncbi:hypothetical protein [Ancylobacter oerskovii]|uniref:Uncharacterized protein n=1 Tax=Ancylobacter oerskovii TaxID=459519 RepID=A0ABW4Z0X5_9HYPH|nr:hypothetical protein [Ancylobacter oerskovii]MBS7542557.1 hypothetical protein [Ancylobacter oerskovii]
MIDIDKIRSPEAIVCHRQINSECGGATVFCVVFADGFIVECGSDGYAERRAKTLAAAVNNHGPDRFDFRAPRTPEPRRGGEG